MEHAVLKKLYQLDRINHFTKIYSNQNELTVFFVYYIMFLSIDGGLFVIINKRTDSIIRTVSVATCTFAFSIIIIALTLFSILNKGPKKITSNLEYCHYKLKLSISTRIKLIEMVAMIKQNTLGISCLKIFTFTLDKMFQMVLAFVINFSLIVKLFQNYLT